MGAVELIRQNAQDRAFYLCYFNDAFFTVFPIFGIDICVQICIIIDRKSKKKEVETMNSWKVWKLYDKDGNLLIAGRKKDVIDKLYPRYVYAHIFTDVLVRTNEPLNKS